MASAMQDLEKFVGDALARGENKADIGAALTAAGWTAEQAAH